MVVTYPVRHRHRELVQLKGFHLFFPSQARSLRFLGRASGVFKYVVHRVRVTSISSSVSGMYIQCDCPTLRAYTLRTSSLSVIPQSAMKWETFISSPPFTDTLKSLIA